VAVPPNRVALAVVTEVIPARGSTFEESQARIRPQLEQQKLTQLVTKRADELLAKAKSMGNDLAKAAKSMGLEVKSPDMFDRQGAVEGLGPASQLYTAFTTADGELFGPVLLAEGRAVGKVIAHVPPEMSQLEAQRAGLRDELKTKKAQERAQLFETGLRERLIKEGKVKIHQEVLNRLIANYRG